MINQTFNEPCLDTIQRMPDNYLDCVITSPPYWQLRDYGWDGQWGLEPTFEHYLENLWSMMGALWPKVKDTGTVWINLGDTYGSFRGKSGAGADKFERDNNQGSAETKHAIDRPANIRKDYDKCLLLLPHRFAIGCIDRGWKVRNDIIWAKRNAMPESVTDRFSKKHEYFFLMSKQNKYYFDLDAIKTPYTKPMDRWGGEDLTANGQSSWDEGTGQESYRTRNMRPDPKGKNPGSVSDFWDVPTKPNKEGHYAQYSDSLIKKPILAGCPDGGIIYDPFMGSGSTADAAIRANRNFIGSEGSKEYFDIYNKRIQPMINQKTLF